MGIADQDSWQGQPMPPATAALDYRERFSAEQFETISRGIVPDGMDDKWFIHCEGPTLYLHRSWTGFCIYEVEFEQVGDEHVVRRALANRDPNQYGNTDDAYDSALLHFLISNLLLGNRVEFPIPDGLPPGTPKGLVQHAFSGTAYPEKPMHSSSGAPGPARRTRRGRH